MADELAVWTGTLRSGARGWRSARDDLADARRGLRALERAAEQAGPRVAPALRGWADQWIGRVGDAGRTAGDHADALDAGALEYDGVDEGARQALVALLAWDDRAAAPPRVRP